MNGEAEVLLWIHGWQHPWLDVFFVVSHELGRTPVHVALAGAVLLWFVARREWNRATFWLGLGCATFLLVDGFKTLALRPRPQLWPRIIEQGGASFPSGHAAISAALYTLIAFEITRHRPRWAPACYALAAAGSLWLGLGRLYLGVHWPTDVLAGWLLGAALAALAIRAFRAMDVC